MRHRYLLLATTSVEPKMDPIQETFEDFYDYLDQNDDYPAMGLNLEPRMDIISNHHSALEAFSSPFTDPTRRGTPAHQYQDNYDGSDELETLRYEENIYVPPDETRLAPRPRFPVRGGNPALVFSQFHQQPRLRQEALDSARQAAPQTMPYPHWGPTHRAQVTSIGEIRLIPASRLPDMYRALFPFGVFNAIQSACFSQVAEGDENMVICAPTGSGKTVLFELAMIRFLGMGGTDSRCIYIAPTKALCSEKYRDWSERFQSLGIKCCEMTGDTQSFGKGAWAEARGAKIIITTPEKLDSLSRNWGDHEAVFNTIELICVDEVHLLGEARGGTLEACLSRMKIRAKSRFILVSATVPNASDIASWIGSRDKARPAECLKFGDEYRPCKLTRHVYGYQRGSSNSFQFDRTLDSKVFGVIQQHCHGKPTLIFCPTRKGVVATAERIVKDYKDTQKKNGSLPWQPSRERWEFSHSALKELAECGVGVHHAGLSMEDRRLIENGFLGGKLFVVVATSTLAVGINLPCHTVVIKGTEMWDGSQSREYTDIDVVQMVGRAGRPQFDREGVAIILCDASQKQKYQQMGSNLSTLESCLHQSLPEHLNSEIVLGAITNVETAREWLRNTFLFRRIQINPSHYGVAKAAERQTWEEYFDVLVVEALHSLKANRLMTDEFNGRMSATEFGVIASRSYVKQSSMSLIIELPEVATKRELLLAISQAAEFKDIRLRQGERVIYNKLCQHPEMRFELKKVERPHEKIFVLLQAILGGISLSAPEYKNSDSVLQMEAMSAYKHAVRLMRCAVEAAIIRRVGGVLKHSLELFRCLVAKAWEDRPIVLRQLEGIGEKSIQVLASHGITTIAKLRTIKPHQLEAYLNRKPPFGKALLAGADSFPRCFVSIKELEVISPAESSQPLKISLEITCRVAAGVAADAKGKRHGAELISILTCTSSMAFVDYRRISTKALLGEERTFNVQVQLHKPSELVEVHMSPNNFAGIAIIETYKPNVSANLFPVPNTRPRVYEKLLEPVEDRDLNEGANSEVIGNPVERERASDLGPEVMNNGRYVCNHRCRDKTSCHHRCCQEGLAKPPHLSAPKKPSISKSTPFLGSQSNISKSHAPPAPHLAKTTKATSTKKLQSLLEQLEKIHSSTATNKKINAAPRLTMPHNPRPTQPDVADDESIPDVEELLHEHEINAINAQQPDFEFLDEEMEAAMADLPSPKLTTSMAATAGQKRPPPIESDVQEKTPKRRKHESRASKGTQSRGKQPEGSPQIIELTSSSESSPVTIPANLSSISPRSTVKMPNTNSESPLFFPSTPPVVERGDKAGNRGNVGQVKLLVGNDVEGDEMEFQLDLSLFEAEEDDNASMAFMGTEPDTTESQLSSILAPPTLHDFNNRYSRYGGVLESMDAEAMQTGRSETKEQGSIFDELEDEEAAFDSFFSGVEIM